MLMKYLFRNMFFISREIVKNIPRTLISSFGIIFLVTFLVLSVSLKKSLKNFLETKVFGQLQINQIKISPQSTTTFIKFTAKSEISDKQVKKIKKIKGIENVQKVIRLNYPSTVRAGMMGRYLKSDMLISGVDKSFFKGTKLKWQDFKVGEHVPVVVPEFAMNLYNNFAAANRLPQLGEKALKIFSMELIIGKSSFVKSSEKTDKFRAKIFGFTPVITTAGIIVPSSFIKNYCNKQKDGKRGKCYSSIMLIADVKDRGKIPDITKKIRQMNLKVESQMDIAEKTEKAIFLLNVTLSFIMAIILILTVIAIFNSYLAIIYNRSEKLSIQRILGASKIRIVMIFITEAAIVGALYGTIGYFIGYYLLNYMSAYIAKWMPILKGLSLKLENHNLLPMALSLSALVSSVSALIPAIFASNLNLFKAMKK